MTSYHELYQMYNEPDDPEPDPPLRCAACGAFLSYKRAVTERGPAYEPVYLGCDADQNEVYEDRCVGTYYLAYVPCKKCGAHHELASEVQYAAA